MYHTKDVKVSEENVHIDVGLKGLIKTYKKGKSIYYIVIKHFVGAR